jgi:hypothetical protein
MKKRETNELPIRAKKEMAEEIGEIIHYLHTGQRSAADLLIEDLKIRSVYLDESIQHDVLIFAEQIQFQYDYDPWHKVTGEIQTAADKLIENLGFKPPESEIRVI